MFLLKGIFIGLVFGAPAGAVGALCVQRSLLYGAKSGLITGLGSSAADCSSSLVTHRSRASTQRWDILTIQNSSEMT